MEIITKTRFASLTRLYDYLHTLLLRYTGNTPVLVKEPYNNIKLFINFFSRFIYTKAKYAPFYVVRIDDVHLRTSDVFSDNVLVQEHIVTDRNSLYKCTNRGARRDYLCKGWSELVMWNISL